MTACDETFNVEMKCLLQWQTWTDFWLIGVKIKFDNMKDVMSILFLMQGEPGFLEGGGSGDGVCICHLYERYLYRF
jgi:hypothetical protein